MNDYRLLTDNPVVSGIFVVALVFAFLIKENQYLKRSLLRLSRRNENLEKIIISERAAVADLIEDAIRNVGRRPADSFSKDDSRFPWACAVLDLDPARERFDADEIRAARRKAIKRLHPDSGGSGLVDQADEAAEILRLRSLRWG